MREHMEVRGLTAVSISIYQRCARRFMKHVAKPLEAVTGEDVEQYLLGLVRAARRPQTRNVNLAAIRCLLRATLRRDPAAELRPAKVSRRAPEILSGTEVAKLIDATTSTKYRAIFMLAYGAGLRVGEVSELEIRPAWRPRTSDR